MWATENEDGNPTLAVVDHECGAFKIYKFDPTLITGGFDDLVFVARSKGDWHHDDKDSAEDVFIVTSSQVDTTAPAIVRISGPLRATGTQVTPTLPGAPVSVWNVVTNEEETSDMVGDPDSMTLDPAGELVLDNRSDLSLYIVRDPKAQHPVLRVPLTLGGSPVEVTDTIFTTSQTNGVSSTAGTIFITDTTANVIYLLTKPYFPSNEIYTAANVVNEVGLVGFQHGRSDTHCDRIQGCARVGILSHPGRDRIERRVGGPRRRVSKNESLYIGVVTGIGDPDPLRVLLEDGEHGSSRTPPSSRERE